MKATGQTRAGLRNRNITVLDRYAIARDKQFCIIEIAGKVYVVGVTNHTMTLLDTIDAAAFAEKTKDNNDSVTPWGLTPVGQYGNRLTKKVVEFIAVKTGKKQQYQKKSGEIDFAESLKEAERNVDGEKDRDENNTNEKTGQEFEEQKESNKIGKINEIGEINKTDETKE